MTSIAAPSAADVAKSASAARSASPDYHRGWHWLLTVTAGFALFTLFAGAEVTSRGAGLSVPDWPTSYGQWMPPMVGGVFYEHGHRMVAATVGFLTLVATLWGLSIERRIWVRRLMLGALGLVVLQGIAGGMTVLFGLPVWLSMAHTTMGQTFFCLMIVLAIVTSRLFLRAGEEARAGVADLRLLRRFVWVALAAIYAQMLLGAATRHNEAGLAVPTFPLAFGHVFPPLTPEALEEYHWESVDIFSEARGVAPRVEEEALDTKPFKIAIHLTHRYGAIVLTIILGAFVALALARAGHEPLVAGFAIAQAFLLVVQIVLGIFVVLSLKRPQVASLHLLGGALLLATTVSLIVWLYRLPSLAPGASRARVPSEVG